MASSGWRRRTLRRRLLRKAKIRRTAGWDARQTPPQPNNELSQTEIFLTEAHRALELDARTRARKLLQGERLREIANDLDASADNFKALLGVYRDRGEALAGEFRRKLVAAREAAREAGRELERFKAEHLLTRPAAYHDSLFASALLVVATLGLAAGEGMLLSAVMRWGLLGGFMNAVLLATPTIAMGLALGFALSACGHVRSWVRRAGGVGLAVLVAGLLSYAFYIGHLRGLAGEALRKGEELALLDVGVLTHMAANPLAVFETWPAVVLIVLQLTGAALAAYDGFAGFKDPYIGYASVDRRYRQALRAEDALRAAVIKAISALSERAIAEIEQRRKEFDQKGRMALTIIARARDVVAGYQARMLEVEWAITECLRLYFDINSRARPAGTLPERFARPISLLGTSQADFEFNPEEVRRRVRDGLRAAHLAADETVAEVRRLRREWLRAADGRGVDRDGTASSPADAAAQSRAQAWEPVL
jgi:hypothetical protein